MPYLGKAARRRGGDALRRREFRLAKTTLMVMALMSAIMVGVSNRDDVVQAQRLESVLVSITADGATRQERTVQTTVGATLKEAGMVVGPKDRVTPATNERVRDGLDITIVRVKESIEAETAYIAFDTAKTFSRGLRPGQTKEVKVGVNGEKKVYYRVRYEDGVQVSKTKVSAIVVRKPVDRVVSIGSKGRYTSRGVYRTSKVMKMVATAYDPGPRSCGKYANGRTANGMRAGYGVVAVDPSVIRLGTRLYIEGYGDAIAGDTGSSIKGNRIDLGFDTYAQAIRFGRKVVAVHVLEE